MRKFAGISALLEIVVVEMHAHMNMSGLQVRLNYCDHKMYF